MNWLILACHNLLNICTSRLHKICRNDSCYKLPKKTEDTPRKVTSKVILDDNYLEYGHFYMARCFQHIEHCNFSNVS